MKRLALFLATNAAVLLVVTIVFRLLGLEPGLHGSESDIDLRALLVVVAMFGMGGSVVSLAMSKRVAKNAMGVRIIVHPKNNQERWLRNTVEQLAREARIGTPQIGIFPASTPNACATGMTCDNALVAVSTGLLQQMPDEQVHAVLGHEISHIANGDMVTLGLLQGVLNTFVTLPARLVGLLVDRTLFRDSRGMGPGYCATTILAQVFMGFLATLIVVAFSRRREYRADAGGALLAGREHMLGALRSLQRAGEPTPLRGHMAAFGIVGLQPQGPGRLFKSHPSLRQRIAALQEPDAQALALSRGQ